MQKIVINRCYGGFGLSYEAVMRYAELKGIKLYASVPVYPRPYTFQSYDKVTYKEYDGLGNEMLVFYSTKPLTKDGKHAKSSFFNDSGLDRNDPILIQVVKELGKEKASGRCGELEVVEIPDGVEWIIEEYDGMESIHESHRSW
jgi:hypothetical protein